MNNQITAICFWKGWIQAKKLTRTRHDNAEDDDKLVSKECFHCCL